MIENIPFLEGNAIMTITHFFHITAEIKLWAGGPLAEPYCSKAQTSYIIVCNLRPCNTQASK